MAPIAVPLDANAMIGREIALIACLVKRFGRLIHVRVATVRERFEKLLRRALRIPEMNPVNLSTLGKVS